MKNQEQAPVVRDWTNRRSTIVATIVMIVIGIPTFLSLCSRPHFTATTVFHKVNGQELQKISDLSSGSRTCDKAIRSMLLAFAQEMETAAPEERSAMVKEASALVQTDFAIVPTDCQTEIDPHSVESIHGLEMSVRSVNWRSQRMAVELTIENVTDQPVFVGMGSAESDVSISDNLPDSYYYRETVDGIYECPFSCGSVDTSKFTKIDPGAKVLVYARATRIGSAYDPDPKSATFTMRLQYSEDGEKSESISFGFYNVKIGD